MASNMDEMKKRIDDYEQCVQILRNQNKTLHIQKESMEGMLKGDAEKVSRSLNRALNEKKDLQLLLDRERKHTADLRYDLELKTEECRMLLVRLERKQAEKVHGQQVKRKAGSWPIKLVLQG